MLDQIVRGPLLIPHFDSVDFFPDGVLAADDTGSIQFAGEFQEFHRQAALQTSLETSSHFRFSDGVMLPPLLDIHTHIPQHPIRGRFTEGVLDDVKEGRLLAGLNRNVFPAEARCASAECAESVVRKFLADTLSHGVVGGAAYMTPSAMATEIALSILPPSWSVGLVLMNQNCPENLRSDESNLEADIQRLANRFGRRLIVTDRFAVAVNSPLRRRASELARRFELRTQTHLNEQIAEKNLVEQVLYTNRASYTDVYLNDGLLNHQCIAAHCIQMTPDEWSILQDTQTEIAHCPTSNLLLGSGVMDLDQVKHRKISYALGTDVGASPTVSMLAEMQRFLHVHAGRSDFATATEALCRSTCFPAEMLRLDGQLGQLQAGCPMSFIEVDAPTMQASAEAMIHAILPADLQRPSRSVTRVTIAGQVVYQRSDHAA